MQLTVGENINGATKMRNNYGAIKINHFVQYCYRNIGLFYIGPCKVIAHLCLILGITSLR